MRSEGHNYQDGLSYLNDAIRHSSHRLKVQPSEDERNDARTNRRRHICDRTLEEVAGQSTTGNVYSFLAFISENPVPSDVTPDMVVTIKISLKLNSMLTVIEGS